MPRYAILNLSDIIEVDINKSIAAFAELGKLSGITAYDCCGILSNQLFIGASIKAALFAYDSTIRDYKLGKKTTDEFIDECLLRVFPCPAGHNADEWRSKLIGAWNKMLTINESKVTDFLTYVDSNPGTKFIVITNSNDLHVQYAQTLISKPLNLTSLESLDEIDPTQHIQLVSSHTAGTFKTDLMIEAVLGKCGKRHTHVYTKYQGDINYCQRQGVKTTLIDDDFNYRTFEAARACIAQR